MGILSRNILTHSQLTIPGEIYSFQCLRSASQNLTKHIGGGSLQSFVTHCTLSPFDIYGGKALENPDVDQTAVLCAGTRLNFISLSNANKEADVSRFESPILCCKVRNDGKMLVTSEHSGLIQFLKSKKKDVIKRLKFHTGPVRQCDFTMDRISLVSAGDDFKAAFWDISQDIPLRVFEQVHSDSITACIAPNSQSSSWNMNEFITASKDGWVKLWDARAAPNRAVRGIYHGKAVENAVLFNSGSRIATACGKSVYIWDLNAQGGSDFSRTDPHMKPLAKRRHHLGVVVDLKMGKSDSTILSGSLDRTVKLTSVEDSTEESFKIIKTLQLDNAVSCVGLSNKYDYIIAGCENGRYDVWNIAKIQAIPSTSKPTRLPSKPPAGCPDQIFSSSKRELQLDSTGGQSSKKPRITADVERLVKQYQYQKSVVEAARQNNANLFVTLCDELAARGALETAMRGKDEEEAERILMFFCSYLDNPSPNFNNSMLRSIAIFLKQNAWLCESKDEKLLANLLKLQTLVNQQQDLMPTLGDLDSLIKQLIAAQRSKDAGGVVLTWW